MICCTKIIKLFAWNVKIAIKDLMVNVLKIVNSHVKNVE